MLAKTKIIYLSIIGIILISGILIRPEFLTFNTSRVANTDTLTFRLWAWKAGLQGWLDNPFSGTGIGTYVISFNKYFNPQFQDAPDAISWYDHAHNFYIDLLSETGLFGFSVFLLFLFAIFKTICKMPKAYKLVIIPCLISYFVSMIFFFTSFVDFSLFVILIAFISNYERLAEE